jgi:nucleotide-binding universal stress UspA family protein
MSDHTQETILVGVDGSPNASIAAAWAVKIGHLTNTPVEALIAWTEPRSPFLDRVDEYVAGMNHQMAEEALTSLHNAGVSDVTITAAEGPVTQVLLTAAEHQNASMVVVGTRGLGLLPSLLLGSISRNLLFTTDRPLVVVPRESSLDPPELTRVLVGVDCSPIAHRVLSWAASFCDSAGVPATVVRCTDPGCERPPGHVDRSDERIKNDTEEALEVLRDLGVEYDIAIAHCDPREALVDTAESTGAGMIVIGTKGEGQFHGLGGTASYLARHSPVPLVVIP